MGSVWRADDRKLGAQVAIKLIDARHAQSKEILARFRREAQVAAAIRSTYVVQILDCGTEDGSGASFIAMELLQGETLAVLLEREGPLEPRRVARLLGHVGRALLVAHEKGIVHRDLKPDNVFLVREGDEEVAKVLDFGIARWRDSGSEDSQVETLAGVLIGTPSYMSPEQATGQPADPQSDIWAFGAIAYECLTGKRPYQGETLTSLFNAICAGEQPVPSRVATVPPGFDAWFALANARDPSVRFSSIKEACEQLRQICHAVEYTTSPAMQTHTIQTREEVVDVQPVMLQMRSAAAIPPKVLEARTTDPGRTRSWWTSPAAIAGTFLVMAAGSFLLSSSAGHRSESRSNDPDRTTASFRAETPGSWTRDALPIIENLHANCASDSGTKISSGVDLSAAMANLATSPTLQVVPVNGANSKSGALTNGAPTNGALTEGATAPSATAPSATASSATTTSATAPSATATSATVTSPATTQPSSDATRSSRVPASTERRIQDSSDRARARDLSGLGDRNAAGF